MTRLRPLRWRRHGTLLAAVVLAGAAMMSAAAPAMADPTSPPAPPSSGAPPTADHGVPTPPAGSITWAVQPSTAKGPDQRSTFTYTNIKPLTVVSDYVAVTNFSKMPVTFQIYASDAFNTKSGSLDLLPAAEKPRDVGSWVKFPKKSITIPPGDRLNEPFTLTVPKNAAPGDHTGGIVAAITVKTNTKGGQVNVDRRLAVPLFLRVSGPLHAAVSVESLSSGFHGTANPFGGGGTGVSYTIHNTGNVRLDLTQALSVTGPFGVTLASAKPKALTNLLPGSSVRITSKLSGVFPAGPLSTHVRVVPAEVKGLPATKPAPVAVSRTAGLWATPWPQLLLLILLVGGGVGLRWWLRRRNTRHARVVADAVAKARRDTVAELTGVGAGVSGSGAGGSGTSGSGSGGSGSVGSTSGSGG
jgi:hypothetical protein